MGVERAVTRWYVLRQQLMTEITQIAQRQELLAGNEDGPGQETAEALQTQMEVAQKRLRALGHCPRPMMG